MGSWISSPGVCINDDGVDRYSGYKWKIRILFCFVLLQLERVNKGGDNKVFSFEHFEL